MCISQQVSPEEHYHMFMCCRFYIIILCVILTPKNTNENFWWTRSYFIWRWCNWCLCVLYQIDDASVDWYKLKFDWNINCIQQGQSFAEYYNSAIYSYIMLRFITADCQFLLRWNYMISSESIMRIVWPVSSVLNGLNKILLLLLCVGIWPYLLPSSGGAHHASTTSTSSASFPCIFITTMVKYIKEDLW